MKGGNYFLSNIAKIDLKYDSYDANNEGVAKDVIEQCAIIAENNTNDHGDYDVGADIATKLRKLAGLI